MNGLIEGLYSEDERQNNLIASHESLKSVEVNFKEILITSKILFDFLPLSVEIINGHGLIPS